MAIAPIAHRTIAVWMGDAIGDGGGVLDFATFFYATPLWTGKYGMGGVYSIQYRIMGGTHSTPMAHFNWAGGDVFSGGIICVISFSTH